MPSHCDTSKRKLPAAGEARVNVTGWRKFIRASTCLFKVFLDTQATTAFRVQLLIDDE